MLGLAGCSPSGSLLAPPQPVEVAIPAVDQDEDLRFDAAISPSGRVLTADIAIASRLGRVHSNWDGTPYRFGGTTRDGIDCSAFVQRVYTEAFSTALTRATATQVHEGREVAREALRPGDLVFFRTGRRQRHVGVYVGGNRFLHASTQRGVTVDALDGYYDRTYWTARRILQPDQIAAVVRDEELRRAPLIATDQQESVRRAPRPAPQPESRAPRSPQPVSWQPTEPATPSNGRRSGW